MVGVQVVKVSQVYIDRPNTETIQYMVLFSHLTVQLPSVELSQKQELAVCNPAPFFCIITHVTKTYKTKHVDYTNLHAR